MTARRKDRYWWVGGRTFAKVQRRMLGQKWIFRSVHALSSISKEKKVVFASVESSMVRIM